ncbi:RNA 2',3'-cyclic phosphodiesterase [Microbulbifer halophilus]|uniref:RNA 2',3'-cyclic phosphodiesterase n=1 Tax=Microbulbifer halophilus TaxID=453963 RepID=A0ABW5EBD1_9GAMM|nr:RNA 2',3'-cyclic phosphodiesterase [Microbulbifer halophilus]MCW8128280.1 RNA 2',3'-cyclic phosphodiesterase [Microbulbifer halophilus]
MAPGEAEVPAGYSRLFIGVRPDADTQHFLDGLVGHCKRQLETGQLESTRWTSHLNRHLTLAFLGETPDGLIPRIANRLQQIAGRQPRCEGRIAFLQPFPQRRSRLLAAELLTNPELDRLHEACRRLMMELGMRPESAAYRPHFTLARNRRGFPGFEPLPADFIAALDNLVLYRSRPAAGGSQYLPLYEAQLAGAPAT